jgi:hypothetical protein
LIHRETGLVIGINTTNVEVAGVEGLRFAVEVPEPQKVFSEFVGTSRAPATPP